jgi:hypothetical protein
MPQADERRQAGENATGRHFSNEVARGCFESIYFALTLELVGLFPNLVRQACGTLGVAYAAKAHQSTHVSAVLLLFCNDSAW